MSPLVQLIVMLVMAGWFFALVVRTVYTFVQLDIRGREADINIPLLIIEVVMWIVVMFFLALNGIADWIPLLFTKVFGR